MRPVWSIEPVPGQLEFTEKHCPQKATNKTKINKQTTPSENKQNQEEIKRRRMAIRSWGAYQKIEKDGTASHPNKT